MFELFQRMYNGLRSKTAPTQALILKQESSAYTLAHQGILHSQINANDHLIQGHYSMKKNSDRRTPEQKIWDGLEDYIAEKY